MIEYVLIFAWQIYVCLGFLGGSAGKDSICNAGDLGSVPGFGRSPGERNSFPLQYSGLESMGSQRARHDDWMTFTFTLCLLCICAKLLQSCLTLCDLMDYSPPGFSAHCILQARLGEWVAMPSSRGSSWPRDWTWVSLMSPVLASGFSKCQPTQVL